MKSKKLYSFRIDWDFSHQLEKEPVHGHHGGLWITLSESADRDEIQRVCLDLLDKSLSEAHPQTIEQICWHLAQNLHSGLQGTQKRYEVLGWELIETSKNSAHVLLQETKWLSVF